MTDQLASLLAGLTAEQRELLELRLNRIPPADDDIKAPVNDMQRRLWFLDRRNPGDPAYNVPFGIRLSGPLDLTALRRAICGVLDRHEALRTRFAEQDGMPIAITLPSARAGVPLVDLGALDVGQRADRLRELALEVASTRFDVMEAPLARLEVVRLAEDDHLLLVVAHHLVFDATSAGIFTTDLAELYRAVVESDPPALPALEAAPTANPAEELRSEDESFWVDKLAHAPEECSVPPDRSRPRTPGHHGRAVPFELPAPLQAAVLRLARDAKVSPSAVVMAAVAAHLHEVTGAEHIALGVPDSGRSQPGLDLVIGCLATTRVIVVPLADRPGVAELLRRVHLLVAEAGRRAVPYARLVELAAPRRGTTANPLFQVIVSVNTAQYRRPAGAAGVAFTVEPVEIRHIDVDMFLAVTFDHDRLIGELAYDTDLYLEDTARRTVAAVRDLLSAWCRGLDGPALPDRPAVTVRVTSSFSHGVLGAALDLWVRRLRWPVRFVLDGAGAPGDVTASGPSADVEVVLLRWEDWSPPGAGTPGIPDAVELMDTIAGRGRDREVPPLVVVCPPSPNRRRDPAHASVAAALDDRLAALDGLPVGGVHAVWAEDWMRTYPVAALHDTGSEDPDYADEAIALMATVAVRSLHALLGGAGRPLRHGPGDAALPVGPGPAADEAHDVVVVDTDRAVVERARRDYPDRVVLLAPQHPARRERWLTHVWPLDPGSPVDGAALLARLGAEAGRLLSVERVEELADRPLMPGDVVRAVVARDEGRDGTTAIPPYTPTERRLAALWEKALDLDVVGVTTDFFQLGGHSLQATVLVAEISAEFGTDLSLADFLAHPSIRELAEVVENAPSAPRQPRLRPRRGGPAPASSTQERLWLLDQLGDEVVRHNTTFAAFVPGDLDVEALRLAVGDVVQVHEVLRTTFAEGPTGVVQVVHPDTECWLPPLSGAGTDPDAFVREHVQGQVHQPFDLRSGPLFRVRLLTDVEGRSALVVGMHHIICDQTSWGIVLEDLAAAYAARVDGTVAPPPPLTVQFADFAVWQREWAGSDAFRERQAYWSRILRGLPRPSVPRTPGKGSAARVCVRWDADLEGALRRLAAQESVTLFAVVAAAFCALAVSAGQEEMVIGVPVAGRDLPELQRVVGCFTDIVPLRAAPGRSRTFRQLLHQVHRASLEAQAHGQVPLASILEALRAGGGSRDPLFRHLCNVVEAPSAPLVLGGRHAESIPVPAAGTDVDLFLSVTRTLVGLEVTLDYDEEYCDAAAAQRFLTDLESLLDAAIGSPDEPLLIGGSRTAQGSDGATRQVTFVPATSRTLPWTELASTVARSGLSLDFVVTAPTGLRSALHRAGRGAASAAAPVVLVTAASDVAEALTGDAASLVPGDGEDADRDARQGAPIVLAVLGLDASAVPAAAGRPAPLAETVDGVAAALRHLAGRRPHLRVVPLPDAPGALDLAVDLAAVAIEAVMPGSRDAARWRHALSRLEPADPDRGAGAGAAAQDRPVDRVDGGGPVMPVLAEIWSALLGVPEVRADDEFFALGGDSLSVLKFTARAQAVGLQVTARDLGGRPTLGHLAQVVANRTTRRRAEPPHAEQSSGTAATTPAQRWFLDVVAPTMAQPWHFTQPCYLVLARPVDPEILHRALILLATHHDVLRLQVAEQDGEWVQWFAATAMETVAFTSHDLGTVPPDRLEEACTSLASAAQRDLRLAGGPVLRAVHMTPSPEGGGRLLLLWHLIAGDAVSRGLVLDDLQHLVADLEAGREPLLAPKPTSYLEWARTLTEAADSADLRRELPFWLGQQGAARPGGAGVPVSGRELPAAGAPFADLHGMIAELSGAESAALRAVARRADVSLPVFVMWSVARAVTLRSGGSDCCLTVAGHGRGQIDDAVNVERTVGKFQLFYPLRLRVAATGTPLEGVRAVARRWARVPRDGVGYGLLRHGADAGTRARMASVALPDICVNFAGESTLAAPQGVGGDERLLSDCDADDGGAQDPTGRWPFALYVVASAHADRLRLRVIYGGSSGEPGTRAFVDDVTDGLRRLVAAEPR